MRLVPVTEGLLALALLSTDLAAALPSATYPPPSHNYTFNELRPQRGLHQSFQQSYFRFNIFFRKNAGISEDFFHRHWKTAHADMTVSDEDAGLRLLRYTQFHQDHRHRQKIQPLLDVAGGLLAVAPYDGIAEFLTKDYKTFEKFIMQILLDPAMVADQQSFVDASVAMHVMAGYDNLIFGGAIDVPNARNGILPSDPRLVYN